jgi:hypothetical protein
LPTQTADRRGSGKRAREIMLEKENIYLSNGGTALEA